MRTIWKFALALAPQQAFEMPCDARVLSVQVQNGKICLWALISSDAPLRLETFYIVGTGNPIANDFAETYIGTVQLDGFVWHVFRE